MDFVFASHEDPDEMPHDAALHLGLHCLSKYQIGVSGPQQHTGKCIRRFASIYTYYRYFIEWMWYCQC